MDASMKYLLIIALAFSLDACMSNEASIQQAAWYESFKNKPLTEKEKSYIKQLEDRGYSKIDIQPPTIGVDFSGSSYYSVTIHSKIVYTGKNADSIHDLNHGFARELYDHIIEDSILFDISTISVSLITGDGFNKNQVKEISNSYTKKRLSKESGFRVMKKEDGTFERVKL